MSRPISFLLFFFFFLFCFDWIQTLFAPFMRPPPPFSCLSFFLVAVAYLPCMLICKYILYWWFLISHAFLSAILIFKPRKKKERQIWLFLFWPWKSMNCLPGHQGVQINDLLARPSRFKPQWLLTRPSKWTQVFKVYTWWPASRLHQGLHLAACY